MGKMELDMSKTFFDINKLGNDGELSKKMLDESAPYVRDVLRRNLEKVIGKNLKGKSRSTGELLSSLGISKIKKDRNGYWNIKIGFAGTDSRGVSNGLKAGVLEYGKSNQEKRPFAAPTAMRMM